MKNGRSLPWTVREWFKYENKPVLIEWQNNYWIRLSQNILIRQCLSDQLLIRSPLTNDDILLYLVKLIWIQAIKDFSVQINSNVFFIQVAFEQTAQIRLYWWNLPWSAVTLSFCSYSVLYFLCRVIFNSGSTFESNSTHYENAEDLFAYYLRILSFLVSYPYLRV